MNLRDLESQARALAPVLKSYVEKALAPALKRIEVIESRQPEKGDTGEAGPAGPQGEPGERGESGKDADPEQIKAAAAELLPVLVADARKALSEEIIQAVENIPKPKDGADGMDGKDGQSIAPESLLPEIKELISREIANIPVPVNGKDGADGKSVPVEDVQRMIDEAVTKAVAAIEKPKDGQPGRDALDIDILPAIDNEKSYQRGTYAIHKGGLWRAHGTTDGMRGWEIVVDGIDTIEIESTGERSAEVICLQSSGKRVAKTFFVPAVIDRGVFKEGADYLMGDGVTFGGSFWIAKKSKPEGKPGNSDDWRLAVKKGRDGKSYQDGKA